jgi:hypothetical protein
VRQILIFRLGVASECRFYLLGALKFTIFTDHKQLQNIYVKALSEIINPRLLNHRLKLTHYSGLTVTWTEGSGHMIADALLQNPVFDPPTDNSNDMALCYGISPRDPLLHNIYAAAKEDLNYQKVVTAIQRRKLCSKLGKNASNGCGRAGRISPGMSPQLVRNICPIPGNKSKAQKDTTTKPGFNGVKKKERQCPW